MQGKSGGTLKRVVRFVLKQKRRKTAVRKGGGDSLGEARRDRERFEAWRRRHPSKTFKDYSAEQIEGRLAQAGTHPSLGGKLRAGPFEVAGLGMFKSLLDYGLKEHDICVDYGCGTMRVGLHVVKYLGRARYWGFDISPRLLEEARALIGENVVSEKAPHLHIISGASVAEAAAAKPDMLFSHRVLPHVHPEDLSEYLQNIMAIISVRGQAIIDGKWSDGGTLQYKPGSWAHSESALRELVARMGGRIDIVSEKERIIPTEPPGRVKSGTFRIVRESNAAAFA
jgi:SAM-dependent methyltransferase